jgi:hypothetical protein
VKPSDVVTAWQECAIRYTRTCCWLWFEVPIHLAAEFWRTVLGDNS